mgnify:FL=1
MGSKSKVKQMLSFTGNVRSLLSVLSSLLSFRFHFAKSWLDQRGMAGISFKAGETHAFENARID